MAQLAVLALLILVDAAAWLSGYDSRAATTGSPGSDERRTADRPRRED